jgi:hypothetical protein
VRGSGGLMCVGSGLRVRGGDVHWYTTSKQSDGKRCALVHYK